MSSVRSPARCDQPTPQCLLAGDAAAVTFETWDLPRPGPGLPPLPADANPATRMIHRLATPQGAALYKRRGATIEPVNGHLKDRTALRRFPRRGLPACQAELDFAALVLNLGKLLRLRVSRRPAATT